MRHNNEVPLSQCPLCGEETDPDAVDHGIRKQHEKNGLLVFVGTCLGALGVGLLVLFFGTGSSPGIFG